MRRFLQLLCFLSIAIPVQATTSVTGKIQNLGTGNVTTGAFVRFWLRGCGGNQPRINGTSIIGPSQGAVFFFDIIADSSGNVTGTLYSTRDATGLAGGDIECGGSTTSVWYGMQAFVAGKGGPEVAVHAKNGVALNITNVTPITTNPVITAPTGDNTYLRLDGGNGPSSGQSFPVTYNSSGTRQNSSHIVEDSGTLVSGTPSAATITFTGGSIFTSSSSYSCSVTNKTTQANPLMITYSSGSSFIVTGPNTVTDSFSFVCVGN